jgi:hypothetical protein
LLPWQLLRLPLLLHPVKLNHHHLLLLLAQRLLLCQHMWLPCCRHGHGQLSLQLLLPWQPLPLLLPWQVQQLQLQLHLLCLDHHHLLLLLLPLLMLLCHGTWLPCCCCGLGPARLLLLPRQPQPLLLPWQSLLLLHLLLRRLDRSAAPHA